MPITPVENKSFSRLDKLRQSLDQAENFFAYLKRKEASLKQLKNTLKQLDTIETELNAISKLGFASTSEQGRFSTIKGKIKRYPKQIVSLFGGMKNYQSYRDQVKGKKEYIWWRLDEEIVAIQKKKINRAMLISVIIFIIGFAGYTAYKEFLAPNPTYIAMYGHQTKMNEYLDEGKYHDALVEAEICITLMPDMAELIIAKAALLEELGDSNSSDLYYDIALMRMNAYDFYSERSIFYLRMNNLLKLEQDAEYLMKYYPTRANGYYFLALSAENSGDKPTAIEYYTIAYEKAEANGDFDQAAMIKIRLATLMQKAF